MNFTKMHGLGNDFIVVAGEKELPADADQLAIQLCNRFLVLVPTASSIFFLLRKLISKCALSTPTDLKPSNAAMRSAAFPNMYTIISLIDATEITVETIGAGVQKVQLNVQDGKVTTVRVDMGQPILQGLQVPTTVDEAEVINYPIEVDGKEFRFTAVSMGNPHCVIYVEDAVNFDLAAWGPKLEVHPMFPRKINVEFVTVKNRALHGYARLGTWSGSYACLRNRRLCNAGILRA